MPPSTSRPAFLIARSTPSFALLALFACATGLQPFAHAQETPATRAQVKEESTGDTKRETQARTLVRSRKFDDLESQIASSKAEDAQRTPAERDAAVAIDLMILAQEARNDARFDDAAALGGGANVAHTGTSPVTGFKILNP